MQRVLAKSLDTHEDARINVFNMWLSALNSAILPSTYIVWKAGHYLLSNILLTRYKYTFRSIMTANLLFSCLLGSESFYLTFHMCVADLGW